MLKILNIISDTNIGGAGKILLTFFEGYDKNKFDMVVVLPKNSLLAPEIKALGVRIIELDALADRSYDRGDVDVVLQVLKTENPDVIHCHGTLSARIAGRKYGKCKIVSTRHTYFVQPSYKKIIPFKWVFGYVNNRYSDKIIAVSPAAKENITEIGTNPKKVAVIFNGVAVPKLLTQEERTELRKELGLSENDFVCAIIARLSSIKGHSLIIEAARKLKAQNENVKILIAGTGELEAELREQAKGLDNVIFLGFVSEVYKIENIMDLQLNASYVEATSLSLLEGMSLGIPALVSDAAGNPFVITHGENGLVVPRGNCDAIVEGIMKIKNDTALYQKMSEQGREIFEKRFTAAVMTREIENVYTELASKG